VTDEKLRLGGMALRNGLLVHGPTHWAAAVRREDGTIAVGSGRKPRLRVADGVAGVRGLLRLAEAVVVLMVGGSIPGETRTISIAIYDRVQAFAMTEAAIMSAALLALSFVSVGIVYGMGQRGLVRRR
jgi:uncharacterized protein YqhQ